MNEAALPFLTLVCPVVVNVAIIKVRFYENYHFLGDRIVFYEEKAELRKWKNLHFMTRFVLAEESFFLCLCVLWWWHLCEFWLFGKGVRTSVILHRSEWTISASAAFLFFFFFFSLAYISPLGTEMSLLGIIKAKQSGRWMTTTTTTTARQKIKESRAWKNILCDKNKTIKNKSGSWEITLKYKRVYGQFRGGEKKFANSQFIKAPAQLAHTQLSRVTTTSWSQIVSWKKTPPLSWRQIKKKP